MEGFLTFTVIVGLLYIVAWIGSLFKSSESNKNPQSNESSRDFRVIQSPSLKPPSTQVKTGELLKKNDHDIKKLHEKEIHHIHHIYVTHEVKYTKTSEENKDHTAAVWNKLGYQIKAGESYSYRFYGREIFKPHQVEKIGQYRQRIASTGLTENQLKVKTLGLSLVAKTGSKRVAKDILVSEYGFNEDTAKYAVGYRGYDDY